MRLWLLLRAIGISLRLRWSVAWVVLVTHLGALYGGMTVWLAWACGFQAAVLVVLVIWDVQALYAASAAEEEMSL